jgi:hypothetical protein
MTENTRGAELLAWYSTRARSFLEEHAGDRVPTFDDTRRRVDALLQVGDDDDVAACFLGGAGVGKSTLLNAVVSDRLNVLPHGGVGSLTAQATVVRFAEKPYLRVQYFPANVLRGILLVLEKSHAGILKSADRLQARDDLTSTLSETELDDVEAAGAPPEGIDGAEGVSDKIEAYQRQLRLMIKGDQRGPIDLPYLLDALRVSLGLQPKWGTLLTPDDKQRAVRLLDCVKLGADLGTPHEIKQTTENLGHFLAEVRDHASGFLAPIIKNLTVGWNAELLNEGLVLVDLPGVGVANDEYRKVTAEWIRERARAIVLVVDTRGVTEAAAELLRSTGFLNRLLHDGDDPTVAPVTLAVAVVKVDLSTDSAWRDDRERNGANARSWNAHFEDLCRLAGVMVREQMRQELHKLAAAGPDATRPEREAAIGRMLETLQVHPVSAPQYRAFTVNDEEDRPRIKSAAESRIPELVKALRDLAADHRRRRRERVSAALADFGEQIRSQLALVQAQWQADTRAEKEAEQLGKDLEDFLGPLRRELQTRQGAFREFLRNGIPEQIESRVTEAALNAQAEITRYLLRLGDFHWATLRATVRRGGAYVSKVNGHLDLPNELALRFEEPVAVVWSRYVLMALRKRTAELGDNYVQVVGEVVAWARGQSARVQPRFVEALHESLISDTKGLASVGKEAIDDLKKKVRAELYEKLQKRVRERCNAFITERQDEGPGVKRRILELFHQDLAAGVAEVAQPVALKVLKGNYNEVQTEIDDTFGAYKNPLDRARDALVSSHEDSVRRSDARRRGRVLDEVQAILADFPGGIS